MQLELFAFNNLEEFDRGTPRLVSFRDLVPEITSTSYLTHSIYYYPAKFIPQVVRFCLDNYSKKDDWIIDPFAGSGTVGLEAKLCQRNAVLTDLNYLLNHIIPIKITEHQEPLSYSDLDKKILEVFASKDKFNPQWSNLNYWYPEEILAVLQKLWAGQKSLEPDLYSQIIQSVLVKVSKQFSYAEHTKPKLFQSKYKKSDIQELLQRDWQEELKRTIKNMSFETLTSVNQYITVTWHNYNQVLFYGGVDSATFEIEQNLELDCLISSPPYLQAQEYIRTAKLDLYWLGYTEKEVQKISKLEIPYRQATRLIETETLNQVRSSLEKENLHKILDSYFCHTINALENATRKLKQAGKACIFVGNPKVDGVEVETWRILGEYFQENGFIFDTVFEDRIKTRQLFKSRKNKNPDGMKSEYLLILEKR
jgi:DNA modification methylase